MQTTHPTQQNFVEVYPGVTLRIDGVIAVRMKELNEIAFGKRYNVWVETRLDGKINILATKDRQAAERCYHMVRARIQCADEQNTQPSVSIQHNLQLGEH